jgi:ketosteroid isomerase-like protein
MTNEETVRAYFNELQAGSDANRLDRYFSPDIVQTEFPNLLNPTGQTRTRARLLADFSRAADVVAHPKYDIVALHSLGDRVIAEVLWSAAVKAPIGYLAPGDSMTALCAIFFEMESGRIRRQRNYDCFMPIGEPPDRHGMQGRD